MLSFSNFTRALSHLLSFIYFNHYIDLKKLFSFPHDITLLNSTYLLLRYVSYPIPYIINITKYCETKSSVDQVVFNMASTWRPFYLRPIVLFCYGSILALLIALLESLLAISERGQGLAPGHDDFRYLWTYGPTAFMTLLTAIWSRIAFQAQSVAPWYRVLYGQKCNIKEALLLDYTSMFKPMAIFKSLRNRDWAVSITIFGLLVSQIAVALSTSLFDIQWEDVDLDSVPIILETAFSNNSHTVEPLTTLDHYATLEMLEGNAPYPRGTTGGVAYQAVRSELMEVAELRTTVDGFTADMACEPASLSVDKIDYSKSNYNQVGSEIGQIHFSVDFESNHCHIGGNFSLQLYPGNVGNPDNSIYPAGQSSIYVSRLITGKCNNGTSLESNRMAIVFGLVKYSWESFEISTDSNFTLSWVGVDTSTQIICQPTYRILRLGLVQNGTDGFLVTRLDNSHTTLRHIHPWDIMEAMLATQNLDVTSDQHVLAGTNADNDGFTKNLFQSSSSPTVQSLTDPQFLAAIISRYCQTFAAQIAGFSLMHPVSEPSSASATIRRYRLTVNHVACQGLVALLSLLLTCCMITLILRWRKPPLAQRTNQMIGVAAACAYNTTIMNTIFCSSPSRYERLEYSNSSLDYLSFKENEASEKVQFHTRDNMLDRGQMLNVGTIIQQKEFEPPGTSPYVLRPMVVALIASFLIAIVGLLETLLYISQKNQGLCKVGDDPYVRYGSAIVPALIMGLIAIYFGSVDYESRTLTPFWLMSGRANSTISLHLDLLNSAVPRIISSEIRSKSYASLAVTIAALLASLFTTFTTPLFSGVVTSQVSAIQLKTNGSLQTSTMYSISRGSDKIISSLILKANLTYPANTYKDLAFVETAVKVSDKESNTTLESAYESGALIHATIPALRARLNCRYPNFDIRPFENWFKLNVEGEDDMYMNTYYLSCVMPRLICFNVATLSFFRADLLALWEASSA